MATLVQVLAEQLIRKGTDIDNVHQRIFLKEILQSYILAYLYNHKEYRFLNLYGGTCLRVIYGLDRMSEDIDLDNTNNVTLDTLESDLVKSFMNDSLMNLTSTTRQLSKNGIFRITLKFPILYELGLSQHRDENLHLKIEISQHRQTAIIEQTPVFRYGKSFIPRHFAIESLMAGKILTCLERSFRVGNIKTDFKARDYYDLLWLMQKEIDPQQEILQTDGKTPYTLSAALSILKERVEKIDIKDLKRDLIPLFENVSYIEAWCDAFHENFERFSQYYLSAS